MPLTTEQIRQIEYHLRGEHLGEMQRLTKVDFIAEMTDHYACALEERLANGQTWQEALAEIDASFEGRKGLRRMEKDFIKGYYDEFNKSYVKSLRAYFYKLPYVLLTLIAGASYMWLYINEHDVAMTLGHILVLMVLLGSMISGGTGLYYSWVIGGSRYTQILRYHALIIFQQFNLIHLLKILDNADAQHLWTALPAGLLVAFIIVNMVLSTQMLYATYYRMKVSLKLR